jgi:hypothetical protein
VNAEEEISIGKKNKNESRREIHCRQKKKQEGPGRR